MAAISVAALVAGCGSAGGSGTDAGSRLASGSDAGTRPAPIVYRPPNLSRENRAPLLIALHPSGGSPAGFEHNSGLDAIARRHGFVVAYLGSLKPSAPAWTLIDMPLNLAYVSNEIRRLIRSENIDPHRVYVTGFSAGAAMAFFVGCRLSRQVDGIAPVSGHMRFTDRCRISHPVSELLIIGTQEAIPLGGTARLLSASAVAAKWRAMDECEGQSSRASTGPVSKQTWSHCRGRSAVGLDVVQGGTHQWPGAPGEAGPDARFDAARAVWAFFAAHGG